MPATDKKKETFRGLMEQFEEPAPISRVGWRAPPTTPQRAAAPDVVGNTTDEFMRPGLQRREMQRLKQGKFRVGERIDLHGLKRNEAHQAFHEFLDQCLATGVRHVLIVCGKGLHSSDGRPVLKLSIRDWLVQRREVLAYCPAQIKDGGTGALYVLLKTGRSPR